jgi:hypothetical protein
LCGLNCAKGKKTKILLLKGKQNERQKNYTDRGGIARLYAACRIVCRRLQMLRQKGGEVSVNGNGANGMSNVRAANQQGDFDHLQG